MINYRQEEGYIALISAIVMSALLLVVTVSLGMDGFFERSDMLDSESKERSHALAQACVNKAIFEVAQGVFPDNVTISVGSYECTIVSVQKNVPAAGQYSISTRAIINKATTNLGVAVDKDFEVVLWKECPADPCN